MKIEVNLKKISTRTKILAISLSFLLIFALGYYAHASSTPNITLDDLPGAPTYTIKNDGASTPEYWAVKYDGTKSFNGTNAMTVLQAVVDALPSTMGGTIQINGHFYATGTLTITKSGVTIFSNLHPLAREVSVGKNVVIQQIRMDATAAGINSLRFQGLQVNLFDFYANGHAISGVDIEDSLSYVSGTNYGFLFRGNAGYGSYVNFVRVSNHKIYKEIDATGYGAITFQQMPFAGTGQIYFNNLKFEAWNDNATLLYVANGAHIDFLQFNALSYVVNPETLIGNRLMYIYPTTDETEFNVDFADGDPFEIHATMTLITIEKPGGGQLIGTINLHDTLFEALEAGQTLTIINNKATADADWDNTIKGHAFKFQHNIMTKTISTAIINLGITGANGRFMSYVYDNSNFNPIGYIANPVSGSYLINSGTGAIVNNTQYTNAESPKSIYFYGGTMIATYVNGQQVLATTSNSIVRLEPKDTVKFQWSVAPTVKVMGE